MSIASDSVAYRCDRPDNARCTDRTRCRSKGPTDPSKLSHQCGRCPAALPLGNHPTAKHRPAQGEHQRFRLFSQAYPPGLWKTRTDSATQLPREMLGIWQQIQKDDHQYRVRPKADAGEQQQRPGVQIYQAHCHQRSYWIRHGSPLYSMHWPHYASGKLYQICTVAGLSLGAALIPNARQKEACAIVKFVRNH